MCGSAYLNKNVETLKIVNELFIWAVKVELK